MDPLVRPAAVHRLLWLRDVHEAPAVTNKDYPCVFGRDRLPLKFVRLLGRVVQYDASAKLPTCVIEDGTASIGVFQSPLHDSTFPKCAMGDLLDILGEIVCQQNTRVVAATMVLIRAHPMAEVERWMDIMRLYKDVYFPGRKLATANSSPVSKVKDEEFAPSSQSETPFSQLSQEPISLNPLSLEIESFMRRRVEGATFAQIKAAFAHMTADDEVIRESLSQLIRSYSIFFQNDHYFLL